MYSSNKSFIDYWKNLDDFEIGFIAIKAVASVALAASVMDCGTDAAVIAGCRTSVGSDTALDVANLVHNALEDLVVNSCYMACCRVEVSGNQAAAIAEEVAAYRMVAFGLATYSSVAAGCS